jgi:CO/xanthine dehydrogenase FAD-binding subunit
MEAYRPCSLPEALALRAEHPEALPVAGGTDLMVAINFRRLAPTALLDLSRVAELSGWSREDGRYRLGAGMTFAQIGRELGQLTALAEASRTVGSPQIRNRATIGGNLQTASPAGDSLPVLAAYDARVILASASGRRELPVGEFLVGPKRTSLRGDELIVAVEFAAPAGAGTFAKVGPRSAMVIAVAGVCLQLDERRRAVRLALGSVGATILRAPEAERYAEEQLAWADAQATLGEAELAEFGHRAAAAATPIDDVRGSAAYRRHVVEQLSRRLLGRMLAERGQT